MITRRLSQAVTDVCIPCRSFEMMDRYIFDPASTERVFLADVLGKRFPNGIPRVTQEIVLKARELIVPPEVLYEDHFSLIRALNGPYEIDPGHFFSVLLDQTKPNRPRYRRVIALTRDGEGSPCSLHALWCERTMEADYFSVGVGPVSAANEVLGNCWVLSP